MNYYMVFGSEKVQNYINGETKLHWSERPIGVYSGETAEEACKAAARDANGFGTFFAVEGFPWGVELLTQTARRLGSTPSVQELLMERFNRLDATDQKIAELTERLDG